MSFSPTIKLEERYLLSLAREEIENLRRLYGRATDALGKINDQKEAEFGYSTFQKIFTPNVRIRVEGGAMDLSGSSPHGWAEVVTNALKGYESTQHLIGTQVVEFEDIQFSDGEIVSGRAGMSSYLQAWHAWPDRKARIVLGTYYDKVSFSVESGWQIYDMTLDYTSVEHRQMGEAT